MEGLGQSMQTWEVALYGLLTVIGMGVVQFFINTYFQRAEKLKTEKIDNLIIEIAKLSTKIEAIVNKISDHSADIAVCKENAKDIKERIAVLERRLMEIEKK